MLSKPQHTTGIPRSVRIGSLRYEVRIVPPAQWRRTGDLGHVDHEYRLVEINGNTPVGVIPALLDTAKSVGELGQEALGQARQFHAPVTRSDPRRQPDHDCLYRRPRA